MHACSREHRRATQNSRVLVDNCGVLVITLHHMLRGYKPLTCRRADPGSAWRRARRGRWTATAKRPDRLGERPPRGRTAPRLARSAAVLRWGDRWFQRTWRTPVAHTRCTLPLAFGDRGAAPSEAEHHPPTGTFPLQPPDRRKSQYSSNRRPRNQAPESPLVRRLLKTARLSPGRSATARGSPSVPPPAAITPSTP